MIFLVRTTVRLPADLIASEQQSLKDQERARAIELQRGGSLLHLWREPEQPGLAACGVWLADSTADLARLLDSLPLRPWMTVREISVLSPHPNSVT